MHIASLVKIPCYLLKLSSGNKNMGVSRANNSVKIWRNSPVSNPKPDLHNINAHTKFDENPLMFTQVIIRKWKTDGRTGRHTDVKRETILPRNYKNIKINKTKTNEVQEVPQPEYRFVVQEVPQPEYRFAVTANLYSGCGTSWTYSKFG